MLDIDKVTLDIVYLLLIKYSENEIPISEIPEDIRNEKWSFHYGQMMSEIDVYILER